MRQRDAGGRRSDIIQEHWDAIYRGKKPEEVGWYQRVPTVSLDLIRRVAPPDASIIDVGGGASTLVDSLPRSARVTVLDISAAALEHARSRVPDRAVCWLCADVLSANLPAGGYDVWHDRAVFHFLTSGEDRYRYVAQMTNALRPGGHAIIATFAEDGPTRCSGLEVVRYSAEQLAAELRPAFQLVDSVREEHVTPAGALQAFVYCLFRRA